MDDVDENVFVFSFSWQYSKVTVVLVWITELV